MHSVMGTMADLGCACLQSHDALLASELSARRRAEQRVAQYAAAAAPLATACAALAGRRLSGVSKSAALTRQYLMALVIEATGRCRAGVSCQLRGAHRYKFGLRTEHTF